jgi:regulatory protein
MAIDSYVDALKMLARRELSEAQVRQRLQRRGYEESVIHDTIARLKEERAIDDARVAEAIARTETSSKRRGRLRVKSKIERAGISGAAARRAVDEAFSDIDETALIEAALAKRLRNRTGPDDDREFRRLYRYLIGQGFEADQVLKALTARRRRG